MLAYCYSLALEREANKLPSNLGRSSRVHRLIAAYGLLNHDRVHLLSPRPANKSDLLAYHTSDYISTVLGAEYGSNISDEQKSVAGLLYDCPVFPGLSSYVTQVAGASLEAARCLVEIHDEFVIAVNWDGGRHHAKKAAASGFCYVADAVLAIQELRKRFSSVAYVDLDVHHGDGVESAFQHSDKVFTISMHRYDSGFFPNSGSSLDKGKGRGLGRTLNIPLKQGLSDDSFLQLIDHVILPAVEALEIAERSVAMVVQCGVDSLALDPLREWNLSIDGYCAGIARIQNFASDRKYKTLYLGGGGYDISLASRCYAAITATLLGMTLDNHIPEHSLWHEYASTNYEMCSQMCISSMKDENVAGLSGTMRKALDTLKLSEKYKEKST